MDNNSLAHTKWNCKYHIVFAPKYRRKIIYGELKQGYCKYLKYVMQAQRSAYCGGRNLSRSCSYVSRNTAKDKCVRFCRVFKGKKYLNDI